MIHIGSYNQLDVVRKSNEGVVLTDGEERVLLPYADIPADMEEEESYFVFVYHDKEGKLTATTKRPMACAGDFAFLKVADTTEAGAFLDIGIGKDVLVPSREQRTPMVKGKRYVVYLFVDPRSNRLVASSWLSEHAETGIPDAEEGEEVSLLIAERSELGYTAVVNNKYLGLLYHNEIYEDIEIGESRQGFIKKVRENYKIDLSLRAVGFDFILESREKMLEFLQKNGGELNLGDKSDPDEIRHRLHMSKKAFKQVIGGLYKERLITIEDHAIRLTESGSKSAE